MMMKLLESLQMPNTSVYNIQYVVSEEIKI